LNLPFIAPAKAYPTVNPQNAEFVTALGNVCSATGRLPTSAVLPTELEKRGSVPVASGGLNDVWQGEYDGTRVAIKVFCMSRAQTLEEGKKVRLQ